MSFPLPPQKKRTSERVLPLAVLTAIALLLVIASLIFLLNEQKIVTDLIWTTVLSGVMIILIFSWGVQRISSSERIRSMAELINHLDHFDPKGEGWKPITLHGDKDIEQITSVINRLIEKNIAAEVRLREDAHFIENIVNRASAPIFVIDANHKVLLWNRSLAAMTNLATVDVKGTDRHWAPFYATERPTLADLIIDRSTEPSSFYSTITPSIYAEGGIQSEGWYELGHEKRYLRFEAAPVFDRQGIIIAAVQTFEDLTVEKKAKEELNRYQTALEKKHRELETLFAIVEKGKREWEVTLDHLKDFVLLTDPSYKIRRYNRLLADVTGLPITNLIGYQWDLLLKEVGFNFTNFDGVQGEVIHQPTERTYDLHIYELRKEAILDGFIVSLKDTTELRAATQKLEEAYAELKTAQMQIFQQEKMASIGQLAAGVAHEINNPMGFVSSNLSTLGKYIEKLREYISSVDETLVTTGKEAKTALLALKKKGKIDYILSDLPHLLAESQDGAERVRCIVQNLKSFSRSDQTEYLLINLNEALETTINIAWNEIKYVAKLSREYGEIPPLRCYPQQLNQVILNLLINAAHALQSGNGLITIRTWADSDNAWISVEDNGPGVPLEIQARIFEPFFTTKPVGQGTGLGLSVSYDIICKHGGELLLESTPGNGAKFIIRLPLKGKRPESNDL